MTDIRDVALAQDARLRTKEDRPPRYRAEIVVQRDSRTGTESVYAFGRPWRVWVRLWSAAGNILPAYNVRGVPAIEGMPVYVTRLYGTESELEIVGVDREMLEATDSFDTIPFVVQHALSHEWPDFEPGFDALTVYPRAISILRTYADIDHPSLSVLVSQLRYWYAGAVAEFGGGSVDLTASVPAGAGQARLVLVYLDATTNAIGTTNGTIGMSAQGWSLSRPTITTGVWPSAFVRLENGQTDINEDDILDARMFLDAAGWPHNLLSTPHHPDSVTGAVAQGDLMAANLAGFARLAIGATNGFRLVRDALQAQVMRWGDDYLWPWNDNFLLMDASAPNTEYATLAAAVAAPAMAGDVILVPPGTHTADNITIPANVAVVGQDRDNTILQTTTQASVLNLSDGVRIVECTIRNVQSSNALICGVQAPGSSYSAELCHCRIVVNNTRAVGLDPAYGTYGDGEIRLIDTDVETSTGSAAGYSLAVYANQGTRIVEGGKIDAGTVGAVVYDVYAINVAGARVTMHSPILINQAYGAVGAGVVEGEFQTTTGDVRIIERIVEAVWPDQPLQDDGGDGDHFRQNAVAVPTGWNEVDAPAGRNTNELYSFWFIYGSPADVSWDYNKQTAVDIETLTANAWASFQYGPILIRDGDFTADVDYYFQVCGQTAAAIDVLEYVRAHLWWDSANSLWKIRAESDANDGGGQTASAWITLDNAPLHQPIFVRLAIKNNAGVKTTRVYWGSAYVPKAQTLLQEVGEPTTWGQVYWRLNQTRGAGVWDYLFIGAVDYFAGEP